LNARVARATVAWSGARRSARSAHACWSYPGAAPPNLDVRLAVVKLLALSGQPDILPAFRRMAVRGSLPPEVRSAVMEAIYQITSQTPSEAPSML